MTCSLAVRSSKAAGKGLQTVSRLSSCTGRVYLSSAQRHISLICAYLAAAQQQSGGLWRQQSLRSPRMTCSASPAVRRLLCSCQGTRSPSRTETGWGSCRAFHCRAWSAAAGPTSWSCLLEGLSVVDVINHVAEHADLTLCDIAHVGSEDRHLDADVLLTAVNGCHASQLGGKVFQPMDYKCLHKAQHLTMVKYAKQAVYNMLSVKAAAVAMDIRRYNSQGNIR